jgi:dienelactone hydrolase
MFHVKHVALVVYLLALPASAGGVKVNFPGSAVELSGYLYEPDQRAEGRRPAIVLMHGCGGLLDKTGKPTKSYAFWATHFQKLGYVALLVDSFSTRGVQEICTQKHRSISPERERSRDAHAALSWLAKHEDVDPKRIHLLGWSNGAMTVLHAVKATAAGRGEGSPDFRSAVAFYPGCTNLAKESRYKPTTPLLIQAGAADDWTPAQACRSLVKIARENGAEADIDVYPEAHHGFDRMGLKLRFRPEVRNANSPTGWGAHVGENEDARTKAIDRATEFIQKRNR